MVSSGWLLVRWSELTIGATSTGRPCSRAVSPITPADTETKIDGPVTGLGIFPGLLTLEDDPANRPHHSPYDDIY